ncbi:hypothetical protein [Mesorhizobium sp.]|uniref:hypothetical protein n=1 Tax=Mesorhizobium sp. TaxID=1871066 RepID=UPI0025D1CEA4|nr:hypothetical protein [Mesorhizobium sp.]
MLVQLKAFASGGSTALLKAIAAADLDRAGINTTLRLPLHGTNTCRKRRLSQRRGKPELFGQAADAGMAEPFSDAGLHVASGPAGYLWPSQDLPRQVTTGTDILIPLDCLVAT